MATVGSGPYYTVILVSLTAFYIIGALIFTRGFLLNRLVVPKYSTCQLNFSFTRNNLSHDSKQSECWMERRFKKAIVIVIDALRHDFMSYNESLSSGNAKTFENKLTVIHDILNTKKGHGQLFKFVADPPTTTMQRIKGLTTGSLPTFIDAGSNFASSEITEDNIISQLKSAGRNIIFMGDDTWLSLFPDSFHRSYPFPSFNVKDLHTVDNGVIDHLIPEIKTQDWDVMIAHFLGVDHCGHRYGPYHQAMADKLSQMDQVLRTVIDELDNDTILLVFGDHGMTKTGDHGGDSSDEVDAGLFVYTSGKTFSDLHSEDNHVVSQTDIVPTLSLLLGIPIPFANLGIIVPSLFDPAVETKLKAVQLNAAQVRQYLDEYSKISSDLPRKTLEDLERYFNLFNNNMSSENYQNYEKYLKEVRELCRSVWARFDIQLLSIGIAVVCFACIASMFVLLGRNWLEVNPTFTIHGIIITLTILFGNWIVFKLVNIHSALISTVWCLLFKFRAQFSQLLIYLNPFNHFRIFVAVSVLSLHFLALFSNSFVVNEDRVLLFFIQTLFLSTFVCGLEHFEVFEQFTGHVKILPNASKRKHELGKKMMTFENLRGLTILIMTMVLARFTVYFRSCREEQQCEMVSTMVNMSGFNNGYHFVSSVFLVALIPAGLLLHLKKTGNLCGSSFAIVAVKYILPCGVLFVALHWLLQSLPAKMIQDSPGIGLLQQVIAPCALYFSCMVTLLATIYSPMTAHYAGKYHTKTNTTEAMDNQVQSNTIIDIFKCINSKLSEDNEQIPIVYGLANVYSSPILICVTCCALPIAILLGPSHAVVVTFMLGHMVAFLELLSLGVVHESSKEGDLIYAVITWSIMSSYYFFSSGHQATIPGIRFEAAFVGLPGDLDSVMLPGALIMLNTFGCDIIFAFSLPLILFWGNGVTTKSSKEEFSYAEEPEKLHKKAFRLCVLYQLCKGIKLLGVMLVAGLHRRHLMVWKIFAPRFIFEGVSFIITSVTLILAYCFVLRVSRLLQSWLGALKKSSL